MLGGSLSKGGGAGALESSAYIIVETNFRVREGQAEGPALCFCGCAPACSLLLSHYHTYLLGTNAACFTCWSGQLLMQVYAHTANQLQRRVLQRLMRTDCLLPNLYVGTLTRETFMEALEAGLKANDITAFLQQHAHPQVARRVPTVPEVGTPLLLKLLAVAQGYVERCQV